MKQTYISKTEEFNFNGKTARIKYQKPAICPHCGIYIDAPIESSNCLSYNFSSDNLLICVCYCSACYHPFIFASVFKDDIWTPLFTYPDTYLPAPYSNKHLQDISFRFIELYNQFLMAEHYGLISLAASGMRQALEFLIKDYAIFVLKEPESKVSDLSLYQCLRAYTGDSELLNTADVVRILGNDFVHYKRHYPQFDYDLLKEYMNIFIGQITTKVMIAHPPVKKN